MNYHVAIRILCVVCRPPHMGEFSSRDAIAFCCDLVGCESMIFKVNPQDLPSGSQVAGRQFCFNGIFGAMEGQEERSFE
jgi:hypothetical protein